MRRSSVHYEDGNDGTNGNKPDRMKTSALNVCGGVKAVEIHLKGAVEGSIKI